MNVSSLGHATGSNSLNFEDLMMKEQYTGKTSYRASKLANVYFTRTLAQTLKGTNIKTVSLHPGVVRTELGRHMSRGSFMYQMLVFPLKLFLTKTPWQGA